MLMCTSACGSTTDEYLDRDIFAMDTYMNLRAYGDNAEQALDLAEARILELENALSVTNEDSDVSRINISDGAAVEVSEDTAELVAAGVDFGALTDGALDMTLYPVLKEWGFTTGEYRIPDSDTLNRLLENVDYSAVTVSGNTVQIPNNYQLDLGSLAKGYTGDEIMEIFRENGVTSAIISLGGNVQTLGKKPDDSDWRVGIKDPFEPENNMCVVEIADKAVITSGNYERFFVGEDGKSYWHIIDPSDGYPADNGLVSVTIIGDNGLMCDALSTALFVAGTEKAQSYWREHSGFDMILVTDDRRILYTEGISESFENTGSMTAEEIAYD